MNDLVVKTVDVLGDTIIAAKDNKGQVWAGVSYFCKALGMNNIQKDTQVDKVKTDKILNKGYRKFPVGIFDQSNETIAIRLDFIPIWLAKISITERMEKEHPELAEKLLDYQLKAKDILAAAFMPKQENAGDVQGQIKLLAQGTTELYERVEKVTLEVNNVKSEIESLKDELPLFPSEADEVSNAVKRKGVEVLGGKLSNAYKNSSLHQKVFANIYINLKYNFKVSSYKCIMRGNKKEALRIVEEYQPPFFLKEQIDAENSQIQLDI